MSLAKDYNHFAQECIVDAYTLWRRLREEEPVARSEAHGGHHVLTRYEDIRAVAQDHARFSSAKGTGIPPLPMVGIIPFDIDPPDHREYRRIINPALSAEAVGRREPEIRALAQELIDPLAARGEFDATQDLGLKLSPYATLAYVGFPRESWATLIDAIDKVTRLREHDPAGSGEAAAAVLGVCVPLLAERRDSPPQGDMIDLLLAGRFEDRPLTDQEILLTLATLLVGAIDTTAFAISSSVHYLATRPEQQRFLREHGVSRDAVEEMIRWSSPVQATGRVVTEDTELGGCPLKKDDWVLMVWGSGNRQDSVFAGPDEMHFARRPNAHLSFGHGPHKCAGLNLGRLMLRIALEELLARVGPFELGDPGAIEWVGGEIRGMRHVPIRVTPA